MKKLFALAMLLVSPAVLADDTLTWVHPTTREDLTPLPITEIRGTQIFSGPQGGPYVPVLPVDAYVDPAFTTFVVTRDPLKPGTVCYRVKTIDTDGQVSVFSGERCKTITRAKPKAPTGFTVQ